MPPPARGYHPHAHLSGFGPTGHHRHPQTPTEERLSNFIRGAERNKSDYPLFSKDSEYLHWAQRVKSTALTHGTMSVLNPTYAPNPNDRAEVELFLQMNAFMYSVLEECVKTDAGMEIIRSYESTMDAQRAWSDDLNHRYINSAAARLTTERLTRELQDLRLSNSYSGTLEGFISDFSQKLNDHDNMVPPAQRFSDSIKIEMLHNACYPHRELRTVRTQVNIAQLWSSRNLSYHEVVELYKVTATPVDSDRIGATTTRSGNVHDIQDHRDYFNDSEDQESFQANVHNRGNKPFVRKPGRLPKDAWDSLSTTDQRNWDTLSDAAKALVLSLQNRNTTSPCQTNHTEVHDDPQGDDTDTATDAPADDTPVESTSVNNVNAHKPRAAGQKTPASSPPLDTLLGRLKPTKETRFQGNVHRLTYRTSSTYSVASMHTTSSFGSLVDRVANGGLAGTDMRVIAVDPNRKVCISGLDNHQVPDLDIVTAGAYCFAVATRSRHRYLPWVCSHAQWAHHSFE
jgi:hypothetical protein